MQIKQRCTRAQIILAAVATFGLATGAQADAAAPSPDPRPEPGACCFSDGECRAVLAEMCPALVGDSNCDGNVDFGDINPFVLVLSGGTVPDCARANCDCNRDGLVDFGDINSFVGLLSQGASLTGEFLGPGTACEPNPCVLPGDTCSNPKVISDEPYDDLGNTCGYTDDYDEICPFDQPGSPDVVYRYVPALDTVVDITLCLDETAYDTKLYVYEGDCAGPPIACNDDLCETASFPAPYVSKLSYVSLLAGHTYYIVVDGYGGACGAYHLVVAPPPPCTVPCPPGASDESEPCYTDANGGCGSIPPVYGVIADGETVCGTSYYDGTHRDTDWYRISVGIGEPLTYTVTVQAEFDVQVMLIRDDGEDCTDLEIEYAEGGPCQVVVLSTACEPSSADYIWIAPQYTTPFECGGERSHYSVTLQCNACDMFP
jgi:hypothetical protein